MLKAIRIRAGKEQSLQTRIAIVASRYNARYVDGMIRAARVVFKHASVKNLAVVRVPGAYEIPVIASRLAGSSTPPVSAIVCFGVILRGETAHAQIIADAVSNGLVSIQVQTGIPIIHGVLLLESEAQARVRCLSREYNRGTETAQTALEMVRIVRSLE